MPRRTQQINIPMGYLSTDTHGLNFFSDFLKSYFVQSSELILLNVAYSSYNRLLIAVYLNFKVLFAEKSKFKHEHWVG